MAKRARPLGLGDWRARRLRHDLTMPERILWYALRDRRLSSWKFRRQFPIGPFIVDFYCVTAKLVLELDGRSHDDRGLADRERQAWLESQGLTVLRFSNDDVLQDIEAVLIAILGVLGGTTDPSQPGRPPQSGRDGESDRSP